MYLNTFYNYLYYQNALQTPSPRTGFTRRLYSVQTAHPQRAHGAQEDPTALPQRPHSALSNTLCKNQAAAFVFSIFKINAATWRSRRLHSVAGDCTARTSAICNFFNALWTPLWCDSTFKQVIWCKVISLSFKHIKTFCICVSYV